MPIYVPPLRERRDDIIPLSSHFLKQINAQYGLQKEFSKDAFNALYRYQWPGNVRELRNMIERVVVTSDGDFIQEKDLPINMPTDLFLSQHDDQIPLRVS